VAERAELTGGCGVYAEVESDDRVDDEQLAAEMADGLLARKGREEKTISFRTRTIGGQPGQILKVNVPEHQALGEYLIEKVAFRWEGTNPDDCWKFEITAKSGVYAGSWADWYRRLWQATRPPTVGENQHLRISRKFRDKLKATDVLTTVMDLKQLSSYLLDPWSVHVYGVSPIGTTLQLNADFGITSAHVQGPRYGMPTEMS
jgi:hypothetical protein